MGLTVCTEPQCLYKGDLYLYLYYPHDYARRHTYLNIVIYTRVLTSQHKFRFLSHNTCNIY